MNKSPKPRKTAAKKTPKRSVPETPPESKVSFGLAPEEPPALEPQEPMETDVGIRAAVAGRRPHN